MTFVVQFDDQPALSAGGRAAGPRSLIASGGKSRELPRRGGKAVRCGSRCSEIARCPLGVRHRRPAAADRWSYRIQGKALVVSAALRRSGRHALLAGRAGGRAVAKDDRRAVFVRAGALSAARPACSSAATWTGPFPTPRNCPQGEAVYEPKTDGTRNPLVESGYVAVSPDLGEVLPNIPHPPSPYRELLGPRIMLDIWDHHKGTYQGDAENLRALKDNGVDHLAIISHDWQRYGYDVKLPDHLPANPQYGGDAGHDRLRPRGQRLRLCLVAARELHRPVPRRPFLRSGGPGAAERRLAFEGLVQRGHEGAEFRAEVQSGAGFRPAELAGDPPPLRHDGRLSRRPYLRAAVAPARSPGRPADGRHGAGQGASATRRCSSSCATRTAARCSAKGATTSTGPAAATASRPRWPAAKTTLPLLDFDLLKLHPQMVNHGMGYYERWFRRGYDHRWGRDAGSMEQIDKYRAQELAYGHAGFVGNPQTDNIIWVAREHHLMHPVQRLYGAARPVEIRYEVDGQWVTASAALAAGDTSRQRIRYDSGLTLWVNWRAEPWQVEGQLLPQWGFLALGPETRVATALARRPRGRLCRMPGVPLCRRADQSQASRSAAARRTSSRGWRRSSILAAIASG